MSKAPKEEKEYWCKVFFSENDAILYERRGYKVKWVPGVDPGDRYGIVRVKCKGDGVVNDPEVYKDKYGNQIMANQYGEPILYDDDGNSLI